LRAGLKGSTRRAAETLLVLFGRDEIGETGEMRRARRCRRYRATVHRRLLCDDRFDRAAEKRECAENGDARQHRCGPCRQALATPFKV
jgi:hypothetical protein